MVGSQLHRTIFLMPLNIELFDTYVVIRLSSTVVEDGAAAPLAQGGPDHLPSYVAS